MFGPSAGLQNAISAERRTVRVWAFCKIAERYFIRVWGFCKVAKRSARLFGLSASLQKLQRDCFRLPILSRPKKN